MAVWLKGKSSVFCLTMSNAKKLFFIFRLLFYLQCHLSSPPSNEDGSVCCSHHCSSVIVTEMYSLTGDPRLLLVEQSSMFHDSVPVVQLWEASAESAQDQKHGGPVAEPRWQPFRADMTPAWQITRTEACQRRDQKQKQKIFAFCFVCVCRDKHSRAEVGQEVLLITAWNIHFEQCSYTENKSSTSTSTSNTANQDYNIGYPPFYILAMVWSKP